jgi:uncharacterized protein (DUF1501 family)
MSCNECTRAQLLRDATAQAGAGLPAVERGMPLPAGTGLNRRSFIVRGGGAMLTIYGAMRFNVFDLAEYAHAAAPSDPVFVSVFMDGGVDSLSVLAPATDATYRRLRPKLAMAPGAGPAFSEDPRLQWHPSAAGFTTLHGEGKLTVVPCVGYADADQSHFTSRHYWEVGTTSLREHTGWMGRYLDRAGTPDNPLQGLSLDWSLSPALAPKSVPVAAVSNPRSYRFWHERMWGQVEDRLIESYEAIGQAHLGSRDAGLREVATATAMSAKLRRQLLPFAGDDELSSPVSYPTGDDFPERLQYLAAMIALGLPLRCVALRAPGGYDTHDNQNENFATDLKLTADSLLAFQRDLEARGLADRVIVHVWSEFGRRPEENGSDGTDHGAAGLSMLMGTQVRGQMIGEFTGLDKLDEDDNLRASVDYRALYGAILAQWLQHDPAAVIPGMANYPIPQVIR